MNLAIYLQQFDRLSEVKCLIISELWGYDAVVFPKPWIKSSRLLEITGQKYFDRRIRELRDELGCAIETKTIEGEHSYRIISAELLEANPRYYLTETEKKELFRRQGYTCQVCGKTSEAGVRGLQADHKVPLVRGGDHSSNNWQSLCNECNVAKRRVCEGCGEDCKKGSWAFPELVGRLILVRVPDILLAVLEKRAHEEGVRVESIILDILSRNAID